MSLSWPQAALLVGCPVAGSPQAALLVGYEGGRALRTTFDTLARSEANGYK
jgi:hypothetical protein